MEKLKMEEEMAKMSMELEDEDLIKGARMRIEGNDLYKKGNVTEAIRAYKKAAAAVPRDPLPFLNLSAAYFESGQYQQCVYASEKAISMAADDDKNAMVNKLFQRTMKSMMNLFNWKAARDFLAKYEQVLEPSVSSAFNEKILEQAERCWKVWTDEKNAKHRIFEMLPRYRQSIAKDTLEYYPFGHDESEPLFDQKLAMSPALSKNLWFSGIGDGRNLFATLISIAKHERVTTKHSKYHIVANDIHPHSIARLLLFFQMFAEMAKAKSKGTLDKREKTMFIITFYYLFSSTTMPRCIFDRVHAMICKTVDLLEKGEMIASMDIGSCNAAVLKSLKSFKDEATTCFSATQLQKRHVETTIGNEKDFKADGAETEFLLFLTTGIILAPHLLREDQALRECLLKLGTSPAPGSAATLATKSYLGREWKPNVTVLDVDFLRRDIREFHIQQNPFDLAHSLYNRRCQDKNYVVLEPPTKASHLYDYVAPFFDAVAEAWSELEGKVKIEASIGDALEAFEGLEHDLIGGRPAEYPTRFDRIHLSNITDYTGGPLSIFLYAAKIINPGPGHYMTSTNFLNFTAFRSREVFYNEYMVISDNDTLSKLMQVKFIGDAIEPHPEFSACEYQRWQRILDPLPFSSLYPRKSLSRWIYALFFRLSVPVDQKHTHKLQQIMQSPNISIFFRLLIHLHQIGYPGHWLSEILASILDNKVITSARPPLTSPLDVAESTAKVPAKKISTAPYVLEMRSLSTLFQRLLPFAMSTNLPDIEKMYRYSIHIPTIDPIPRRHATLVFHRESLIRKIDHYSEMMEFTMDDEFDSAIFLEHTLRHPLESFPGSNVPLKHYQKLYDEGLVVVSTFDFDTESNTASFWMSSEDAENVFGGDKGKDWKASLFGFMIWQRYSPLITVKGNLTKGEACFS